MEKKSINLLGKVCPYPVVSIVKEANMLPEKGKVRFLVDDPLAIKSVPEELENYKGLSVSIKKEKGHWIIELSKK